MNRSIYYNYIDEKLNSLAARIEQRGKLNILDLHLHSESFYLFFFNELFKWQLENLNAIKHNVEAIDLIEKTQKIIVQVSATATKHKIESTLGKNLAAYALFAFKFISISKDAAALRTKIYKNPHGLAFEPEKDVHDIASILKVIFGLSAPHQKRIFDFVKSELGSESDVRTVESNLASIVGILGNEDWDQCPITPLKTIPYNVEKKIEYNTLKATKSIVHDYAIYYNRLDKIYSEFNKLGKNKCLSVWRAIHKDYVSYMNALSGDSLLLKVIECVTKRIEDSANYKPMPYEELELCVNILVVDAFIRCKIFEEPPKEEIDATA